MANHIGYLIRHDLVTDTKTIISYADIYINKSIFFQLAKDIEDSEIVFSCSCAKQPISLELCKNGLIKLFHSEHTQECYNQYISMIFEITETKKGTLLQGQTIDLHLSLKRDIAPTLCIIDNETIFHAPLFGNMDLSTYVGLSNIIAFNRLASHPAIHPNDRKIFHLKIQEALAFQFGTNKLRDLQGHYFSITSSTFLNEHVETGKTYFYYGFVHKTDIQRQYVHLTCVFNRKSTVITVPLALWYEVDNFTEPLKSKSQVLCFSGFVNVVERTRHTKGSYDPYTHTSYSSKKQKIQEYTLKHGVLFHSNMYGLICFSESEAEEGNHAMKKGYGLVKPIFPFYRKESTRLNYHSSLIAQFNNEIYYDHFLENIK